MLLETYLKLKENCIKLTFFEKQNWDTIININNQYKLICKRLKREIEVCKQNHYTKIIDRVRNKSTAIWNIIKRNNPSDRNSTSGLPGSFKIDDEEVVDLTTIANKFNNFYLNITKTLDLVGPTFKSEYNICNSLFVTPCTEHEIYGIIMDRRLSGKCQKFGRKFYK